MRQELREEDRVSFVLKKPEAGALQPRRLSRHHRGMTSFSLLTLRLHSPLCYLGLENPPFLGLDAEGGLSAIGACAAEEGREELFVFEDSALVAFDPDDGPKAPERLPSPAFYGQAPKPGAPAGQESRWVLPAGQETQWFLPEGNYLFMQWRPSGEEEFLAGLEWFAREAWWEGHKAVGPWFVRRILEDGKVATQLIRALPRTQAVQ
jgi:hypothetical protein